MVGSLSVPNLASSAGLYVLGVHKAELMPDIAMRRPFGRRNGYHLAATRFFFCAHRWARKAPALRGGCFVKLIDMLREIV